MQKYIIKPLEGVEPVRLGMPRAEVHRVMPAGRKAFRKGGADHEADAWHGASFQIFYSGAEMTVEYIELSANASMIVMLNGIDVFATPASELCKIILATADVDKTNPEFGHSYIFPSIGLALWRPVQEQKFFSTIGISAADYFR